MAHEDEIVGTDKQGAGASDVRPLGLPRSHRLSGGAAFQAVYGARAKQHAGPLTVFTRPNGLDHPRLGLSVGRRVGRAVKRNAVKRRLREAFRLSQWEYPRGYDVVIAVRPHETLSTAAYRPMLERAIGGCDRIWQRRSRRDDTARDK